jgi:hypothetical protein
MELVLDTDILLSYLSKGERPHDSIYSLMQRWRAVGGASIVKPILEEAAYHAWISMNEYNEVWNLLNKITLNELPMYTRNAFVRGFYVEADGRYHRSRWNRYIVEYRGDHKDDASKLTAIFKDEKI